jgi:uncharacterized protein (TIGR02246 family)
MSRAIDFAEQWLQRYGRAWEQADPAAAARLFSEDCLYFETPHAEPLRGRAGVQAYWTAVPKGQADVSFRYELLALQSDTAIAHWCASFTRKASGARVELDGMFLVEFDEAELCRTPREWWHRQEPPRR